MFGGASGLDRRGFIAVLGGAGLCLGFVGRDALAAPAGSSSVIGPYIDIHADGGISIFTPGAEMGQGVHDALPKMIAEELECDWERVTIRLSYADLAFSPPTMKYQRSANSDAVINYYQGLRLVGASAREMLIAAAAARWTVDPASVTARRGALIHQASGRRLTFADVAADASRLTPPQTPTLKAPSAYALIGRTAPRKDIPAKVAGTAVFGIDVEQPGMLYAAILHAPQFGGSLRDVDLAPIRAKPGVQAVLLLDNGEIGVIADSFWRAKKALADVKPPPAGGGLSSAEIHAQLEAGLKDEAAALPFPTVIEHGAIVPPADRASVEALIAGAPKKFDQVYEVPYLAHATLEPPCCTSLVEPGKCTVWAPHQNATKPQKAIAAMLGLQPEAVSFNRTFLGGGFGRKNDLDFVLQSVQLAKAAPGRPVKLIWTREEDIRHGSLRPAFMVRTRAGLDAEGRPVAMLSRMSGQPADIKPAFGIPGMANATAAGDLISGAYGDHPRRIEYAELKLPIHTGYWRSVTGSQNGFFSESAIDELASLAGKDPVEFRLSLLSKRPRTLAVLRKVVERSGWGHPPPAGVGRGVAVNEGYGSYCAQVAEVSVIGKRVEVKRICCAFDCGQQIDPGIITAQLEGGIIFGLTAALAGEITIADGGVMQSNFDGYRMIKLAHAPKIDIDLISGVGPIGGAGEAGVPLVAPAVASAIFAATGRRVRKLPISANGYEVL